MIDEAGRAVAGLDEASAGSIQQMAELLIEALEAGGRVYVCGNGGSAADAQHIAGELAGRFRRERRALACVALSTDTSVLTAVGNDYSYEDVFSRQVEALASTGDVLWALSTSGNSPNVLKAARYAADRGAKVIAMTGRGGGKLAGAADVCLRAPADRTDLIQLLHQVGYHIICELIDEHFSP
ncbi:MAG: D-sedoheptulose-7-phosphate isomerase [Planctomycetota bacterium]|jgi:D-sedoheptulose 7-phosphate isomerase